ncbi:unnamed protein product [Dicrocoelium dendriticum]|nr:unnamed protein product [Dicrocoelium dendriticum]
MVSDAQFLWRDIVNQALLETKGSQKLGELLQSIERQRGPNFSRRIALELLRSNGIVDAVLDSIMLHQHTHLEEKGDCLCLQQNNPHGSEFHMDALNVPAVTDRVSSVTLLVELIKGRGFIEDSVTYDEYVNNEKGIVNADLFAYLELGQSRFRSPAVPYTSEPRFFCLFSVNLADKQSESMTPQQILLEKERPWRFLSIVIVSCERGTQKRKLVSSVNLDWRQYIFGKAHDPNLPWTVSVSLELRGVDPDSKITAGILDLRLRLLWPLRAAAHGKEHTDYCAPLPHPIEIMEAHFSLESSRIKQREQALTLYVRQWWAEFTQLREGMFAKRMIKLFALDERSDAQFVCKFVRPLSVDRILETPSMAARFVSTIPCEPCRGIGSVFREQWCSALAFVARNRGDVHDHANLLCSLFLGFGLDAYVALGTSRTKRDDGTGQSIDDTPYAWVVVLLTGCSAVTFWDAVSGRCFDYEEENPKFVEEHLFQTIGCMYNHKNFYANIQTNDSVSRCSFNLSDESLWRAMSSEVVSSVAVDSTLALHCLCGPESDTQRLSYSVEGELQRMIEEWRSTHFAGGDCTWKWDSQLSRLLAPILAGFEANQLRPRVTDPDPEAQLFMDPVRRYIPNRSTFKAYPLQLLHANPKRIFTTSLRSRLCRDILTCRGEQVRLALRVRIYSYAEEAIVTWVIFACVYGPMH